MVTMGLVHNFSGLMAARWFLGLAEAGLFPGVSYFLSCWYKRSEFGIRMAIFFSAAAIAGSFGGLLAAAISNMNGVGGKAGWAWIFILEGLATVVLGFMSFWMVYDFPDNAKFLSDIDRKRVLRRLALDQQSSAEHEEWKTSYLWASLKDWKTYMAAIIYMGADGPLYAFSLFIPTIINELVRAPFLCLLLHVFKRCPPETPF
jgi:MFS family permease